MKKREKIIIGYIRKLQAASATSCSCKIILFLFHRLLRLLSLSLYFSISRKYSKTVLSTTEFEFFKKIISFVVFNIDFWLEFD